MTEREIAQLKDTIRPAIHKALAKHGITPGSDGGDPEPGEFSPSDLPQFSNYFAPDDSGCYPGHIHTFFNVTPKRFSEVTNLRQRASGGRTVWVK